MTHPPAKLIAAAVILAAVAVGAWLLLRPHADKTPVFTGYVTAQTLYMASPVAGTVSQVSVARGQRVAAGAPLFRIDPTSLAARADQAGAQIGQNQAQLAASQADLGRASAALAAAQAEADKAAVDLARMQAANAQKAGSVAQQQVDQASAAATAAARQRDEARSEIAAAQARIAAAGAQLRSSRAGLTDARRQVVQLAPTAPAPAIVENVMFQPGEWAAPNTPVVALVPDNQVKVRFYVPQAKVAAYRPGTAVAIACDGCATGMTARVDFVAPRPEYTPPVIYSLATRDKLVFLVEAVPSNPGALVIGQPMDVRPAP
jgi:HlyD family secretion protein